MEKDGSSDLDVDWLVDGWLALLHKWIHEAEAAGLAEPNAMVLATVADGHPVTRSVLCKSVDADGVTFTTPRIGQGPGTGCDAVCRGDVPWYGLGRQVHVRGAVTKVAPGGDRHLLGPPPRGSLTGGAWASSQSQPIGSRADLVAQLAAVIDRFADSRRFRCRRTGAATASRPRWSSSGRAGRTGFTNRFASSPVSCT